MDDAVKEVHVELSSMEEDSYLAASSDDEGNILAGKHRWLEQSQFNIRMRTISKQLFVMGILSQAGQGHCGIDDLFGHGEKITDLGPPAEGREVLNDRGWSIEELKAFVRKSFPNHPLDLVDFKFARCIKGARQEMDIIRPTSVAELAREIKAGKIYIIPIKQLPCTTN
ncbi:unnamed protein product [Mytilus edulis]|uniref:Uncharacterized protein n=1 Tax=Mytilus edulis TaxID=6550 RepID=A0A8S3U148_MYTED|nr:unnamed protein product [Mytilus edulis]